MPPPTPLHSLCLYHLSFFLSLPLPPPIHTPPVLGRSSSLELVRFELQLWLSHVHHQTSHDLDDSSDSVHWGVATLMTRTIKTDGDGDRIVSREVRIQAEVYLPNDSGSLLEHGVCGFHFLWIVFRCIGRIPKIAGNSHIEVCLRCLNRSTILSFTVNFWWQKQNT